MEGQGLTWQQSSLAMPLYVKMHKEKHGFIVEMTKSRETRKNVEFNVEIFGFLKAGFLGLTHTSKKSMLSKQN